MTTENYTLMVRSIAAAPTGTEVICVCVTSRNADNSPYSICGQGVTKTRPIGQIELCAVHDRQMSEAAHAISASR